MKRLVDFIRQAFRTVIRHVAKWLSRVSNGQITPDAVTIFGMLMHVPIAIMIARGRFVLAAILLIVFGLFDTLDGELARLQKRDSARGMLLDAASDRIKEVMLYSGVAYFLAVGDHPAMAVWAVIACGASLSVSYVKAKGESAVATSQKVIPYAVLNKMFSDGVVPFEIRIFLLIVGLLTGQLLAAVVVVAVLASYTALWRLVVISKKIS